MADVTFNLADSVALSEALRAGFGFREFDIQTLGDSGASISLLRPSRSADDNLNLADATSLFLAARIALTETIALSDAPGAGRTSAFLDSLSLTDVASSGVANTFLALAASLGDAVSFGDFLAFSQPSRSAFGDGFAFADSARAALRETDLAYLRRYANDF